MVRTDSLTVLIRYCTLGFPFIPIATFYSDKKFKNLDDIQIVLLLKHQLIFKGQELKICPLDGKILIMRISTLLIKNKNLLKIYSFEFY